MKVTPPQTGRSRAFLAAAIVLAGILAGSPSVATATLLVGVTVRLWLIAARSVRARRDRLRARAADGPSMVLGVSPDGRAVVLPDRALGAHGLILGASGSGKSTTMLTILQQQIASGRPVVAIDLKGSPEFAHDLQQAAHAAGRPFRHWTPDGQAHWNPLASGNATELKDKLIATERFTEPHYQRAAERFLQLAIQVLRETRPGDPVSLAALVALMDPRRLGAQARTLPPARREPIAEYLASLTGDQLSAIRGLGTRLAVLSESHTGPYLEPPADGSSIDLHEALGSGAREAQVILFSLNSSTYGRLAAQLGTLAIQDVVSAAGARLTIAGVCTPPPAVVAIDEFSALQSDNVMALLARGRASGIGVLLATQELADLDRAAQGLRDQVLGNTAVKIAHRQDVPQSAETVARLAGTRREWERTYHERPGMLGTRDLRRSSLRLVDRYAIEPSQVSTLATGEAVVIVKSPRADATLARIERTARRTGRSDKGLQR